MKEHVKILVMGDEGVGKSSLISSYVSRYFSEVPPVVTDCYLRADTTASGVAVTIMDSSARFGDRDILIHKIRICDSIILCYDSSRLDTLDNISKIWLPLIQREKQDAKVIIAITKCDILEADTERNHEIEQRTQDLFKRFPVELILAERSSSKLLNVDRIFFHAEQVVTFPLTPIYDSKKSQFTTPCLRAFLHIFRVYDWDGDGLLSDIEFNRLHSDCFNSSFSHEELVLFKKQIAKHTSSGIKQGKVAFEGLISMIRRFITSSQYMIPWAILRRYDYDDDLILEIPSDLEMSPDDQKIDYVPQLSFDAIEFLERLFINALDQVKSVDSNSLFPSYNTQDYLGTLVTMQGRSDAEISYFKTITCILSVIMPDIATPWKSYPIYEDVEEASSLLLSTPSHASISANTLITAKVKHKHLFSNPPGTSSSVYFSDYWLLYWHMLALHRPTLTQVLLYRLGYVERTHDYGIVLAPTSLYKKDKRSKAKSSLKKPFLRICILGRNGVGKRSFVWSISKMPPLHRDTSPLDTNGMNQSNDSHGGSSDNSGQTSSTRGNHMNIDIDSKASINDAEHSITASSIYLTDDYELVTGGCLLSQPINGSSLSLSSSNKTSLNLSQFKRYSNNQLSIVATAVPLEMSKSWINQHGKACDIAILMFDCDNIDSIHDAIAIEDLLPSELPRVYVANKSEHSYLTSTVHELQTTSTSQESCSNDRATAVSIATTHIMDEDLSNLIFLSVTNTKLVDDALMAAVRVVGRPEKGIPKKYRRKPGSSYFWTILSATTLCTVVCIPLALGYFKDKKSSSNDKNSLTLFGSCQELIISWTERIKKLF